MERAQPSLQIYSKGNDDVEGASDGDEERICPCHVTSGLSQGVIYGLHGSVEELVNGSNKNGKQEQQVDKAKTGEDGIGLENLDVERFKNSRVDNKQARLDPIRVKLCLWSE